MIVTEIIIGIATLVDVLLSWLPEVTTLPTIIGFDIDSALITGVTQLKSFMVSFWPISYMFNGFLFLMGYFVIKVIIKVFLGSRAPGS